MIKFFTKSLSLLMLLTTLGFTVVFAQTITIGAVDPGPYGKGSTIAIPFHVNDASGCITQGNVFSLYLCNANGTIISAVTADTLNRFYGTFFNYTVPATLAAGNYTLRIKSSSPALTSGQSNSFNIVSGVGSAAAVTSSSINSKYPEVFGTCSGVDNTSYTFINASAAGSVVTAGFFNELTQSSEASNISLVTPYNFNARAANYTVTIKAVNAGIVSTYAYQLINNLVNTSIGATGNPSICLNGPTAPLTYNVDISSPLGIQNNYPGNTYTFAWGDGSANTTYTLCQILALNGQITHNFTQSSCGFTANNRANSFEVDFQSNNTYCGKIGSAPSNYAQVLKEPINKFSGMAASCSGTPVSFINQSDPGADPNPNAATSSCAKNPNATYNWLVDGVVVKSGYTLSQTFTTTFTRGTHTVSLHLQNPGPACSPTDVSETICVQDPPKPSFTLPQSNICVGSGPVIPTNTSVIDIICNTNNTYNWTVTPSAGVTFDATSATPQFSFINPGVYQINLSISNASCGAVQGQSTTLTVNATPTAKLSPDFSTCGNNQQYFFNNTGTNNPTFTTLTGTSNPQANTYTWTVTGGAYTFDNGTTANSEYPYITFNNYATYTVTVTQQNSCGSITSQPQHIKLQQAPTVSAGTGGTICAGKTAALTGTITGTGVTSTLWTGGGGTYSAGANSLVTQYQPTQAEINAGQVTLTLVATTSIAAPCNSISSSVTFNITPVDAVTSVLTKTICSNTAVNYLITATDLASTFTWTAKLVSGSASGITAGGNGNYLNGTLVDTDPSGTTNAVVAYTITPISSNGCPGTPAVLNVTVTPLPILSAAAVNPIICSGQSADIALSSKLSGTNYTWTSTSSGMISGNTNSLTPTSVTPIQDILVNPGTTPVTVTYVITPISTNGCTGNPVTTSVIVEPQPIVANAGADASICNTTTYQLQGNSPSPGTGQWTLIRGPGGVTFSNAASPTTTVSGLIGGNAYQFQWVITSAPGCTSSSAVTITVNKPTVPGTTSSITPTTVCAGSNSGQITLSGELGLVTNWETSVDNGATWTPISPANTTDNITYLNLTQTTLYQAIVQNGSCGALISTSTKITVNQPAITAVAGPNFVGCNILTYTLQGNNPGTFTGVWTEVSGPPVTFANASQYNTIVNNLLGGNVYVFRWTIQGVTPCTNNSSDVTITDNADYAAAFSASSTDFCGSQNIIFSNETPNATGAQFSWDFGDGTTSTVASPTHLYQENPSGRDTSFVVSLSVLNSCQPHQPVSTTITIRPLKPIATIYLPQTSGCSPFNITVKNTSPGNNPDYKFYLFKGNTQIQVIDKADKSDAVFSAINATSATTYSVYMVATGHCGTQTQSNILPLTIAPPNVTAQMFVQNGVSSGCAPLSVQFINNSLGGTSYHYNIYDDNGNLITSLLAGTDIFPYTFTGAGNYSVSISVANNCTTGVESAKTQITVYPVPLPNFTTSEDCTGNVLFANTTADNGTTPASSLNYSWDFGDGSATSGSVTPQPHHYDYTKSPFTVTLTVSNPVTSCPATITQLVNVSPPLAAAFSESNGSIIDVPNYTFLFSDGSSGSPVSWAWTFGDGTSSGARNPEHTYADTGSYTVTLTVINKNNCTSTITQKVRITGTPGQLYLPNAFMPTSGTTELRTFMAKGSGIKTWLLQIFNNYGQLVWQTTKLDDKGVPVESWDGIFKGAPAPQGTYLWQASAVFINGLEWKGMAYHNGLPKRTGTVNLIR